MTHKFDPANMDKLLNPERVAPYTAATVIKDLCGLKKGMTFLDVGAGPGFFTKPALEIVCPAGTSKEEAHGGHVYVVDTEPMMIAELNEHIKSPCLTITQSDEYDFKVPDSVADITFMAFILHEVIEPFTLLEQAKSKTKSGGAIVIMDWDDVDEDIGPPRDHRISKVEAELYVKEAELKIIDSKKLNDSHYFIKATKI